jgi:1,4-dihydroxy-6-naphthoate synthase
MFSVPVSIQSPVARFATPTRKSRMPATPTQLRTLRFGHSPDADDAYMFYGFHTGDAVIDGCKVEHVLQDIQSLNVRAIERGDLEITACSAHAYAYLADRYAVLACGASFGWGYGPVLVAREARDPASLRGRKVAIPGRLTTAALLLRTECPDVETVEVMFDDIPRAVLAGEVEAGVIIHESQLTYREEGLAKVLDFGELWRERDGLPVPLGLDVVRRDLGAPLMRACSAGFRRSIDAAFAHEDEAIRYALQFGRGLDTARGKTFVHMYVNELTLDMGARGRAGLQLLYDRALACGAIAKAPDFDVV